MSERSTAPRSGGRTTERADSGRRTPTGTKGTARGARQFPVHGNTALKLDAEPQRETASAPRLRVAPPLPINAPRAPFIALVVAIVVAGVVGILLINTKTAENSFELDTLDKQRSELDARQQALENEIAAYNMPGSLDVAARRLGLVKADSPAYIRLPDGKVMGVMTPGSGPRAVTAQDPAAATANRQPAGSTTGQQPAGTTGQQPAGSTGQQPSGTTGQQPAGSTGQQPAGTTGQLPAGSTGQQPSGTTGQLPANGTTAGNGASSQDATTRDVTPGGGATAPGQTVPGSGTQPVSGR